MADSQLVKKPGAKYKQPTVAYRKWLFKEHVNLVSVETHSYCNRQCWFCPNSFIDRHSKREYLPEQVYCQMLSDLAGIDYAQTISFARYMEPFADEVIYERIAQARAALPNAQLRANTNGDFVTSDTLKRMAEAGLNRLAIQLYFPSPDTPFDEGTVFPLAKRKQSQLGVEMQLTTCVPHWFEWAGHCHGMTVDMRARDFRVNGENRGGIDVSGKYVRLTPCPSAFHTICIHYSQEVISCCHLRSDHPDHAVAILGKVESTPGDLFRVYTSEKAAAWRGSILHHGPKAAPCADCAVGIPVDERR